MKNCNKSPLFQGIQARFCSSDMKEPSEPGPRLRAQPARRLLPGGSCQERHVVRSYLLGRVGGCRVSFFKERAKLPEAPGT